MASQERKKPKGIKERLDEMEGMVAILLAAALRGRVLPSERQLIKPYLDRDKKAKRVEKKREEGVRCPACRSPLPDPGAERCPYCSLLLEVARQARKRAERRRIGGSKPPEAGR